MAGHRAALGSTLPPEPSAHGMTTARRRSTRQGRCAAAVREGRAVPGHGRTARTTRRRADYGPDYCPSRLLPVPAAQRASQPYGKGQPGALGSAAPQLVRALALHGVIPVRGSHLGSPLGPGRPVLIRSVSRRVGSVACVREDASPNEVSGQTAHRIRQPRRYLPAYDRPLTMPGIHGDQIECDGSRTSHPPL